LIATGQRYQLLLQPVLIRGISTGCNSSWYLWPGPLARFLVVILKLGKLTRSQIKGVVPHLVDDGLSILQYADDTVIFMDHDIEQAKNMKVLLCMFEQLSDFKINFLRVKSSASDKQGNTSTYTQHCLGSKLAHFPYDI
jgi:hypothetical protein